MILKVSLEVRNVILKRGDGGGSRFYLRVQLRLQVIDVFLQRVPDIDALLGFVLKDLQQAVLVQELVI